MVPLTLQAKTWNLLPRGVTTWKGQSTSQKLAPIQTCNNGLKSFNRDTFSSWTPKVQLARGNTQHCIYLALVLTAVTSLCITNWFSFQLDLFHYFKSSNQALSSLPVLLHLPTSSQFQCYKNNRPILQKRWHSTSEVTCHKKWRANIPDTFKCHQNEFVQATEFPNSWWHQMKYWSK